MNRLGLHPSKTMEVVAEGDVWRFNLYLLSYNLRGWKKKNS